MPKSVDTYLKVLARNTAERLAGSDGEGAVALASQLSAVAEAPPPSHDGVELEAAPAKIGMWHRTPLDGQVSYVRHERSGEDWASSWLRWADVERIPPKASIKRIVLLGESAAAGFAFEPAYRPSRVLEQMLSSRGSPVEVVDLTASGLVDAELVALLRQVTALEPDALVVFAGNNWADSSRLATVTGRHIAATAVRTDGITAMQTLVQGPLATQPVSIPVLRGLVEKTGIPTVVLIPEFNLLDWKDAGTAVAPWLSGDANRSWWVQHHAAVAGLRAGDLDAASLAAREMTRLDGGTSPIGFHILGQCLHRMGRRNEARAALEKARDASTWREQRVGRCPAFIVSQLASLASANIDVVDLAEVFQEASGELPNRQMFIDYVHLNANGIRHAMAAAARALLARHGTSVPLEQLVSAAEPLAPAAEAQAHLMTAGYNAHLFQEREIVDYHLARAVELARASGTLDVIADYMEVQGRRSSPFFTTKAEAFVTSGGGRTARTLVKTFLNINRGRYLDDTLLDSLGTLMTAVGVDLRSKLATIRAQDWSILRGETIDLLSGDWRTTMDDRSWPSVERGFFRAYQPTSSFRFVVVEPCELRFAVTLRLGQWFTPDADAELLVNDHDVVRIKLGPTWTTHSFGVSPAVLREGVNHLSVRWPAGSWAGETALSHVAEDIEMGRSVEFMPSFADVYAVRVSRD